MVENSKVMSSPRNDEVGHYLTVVVHQSNFSIMEQLYQFLVISIHIALFIPSDYYCFHAPIYSNRDILLI